MGTFADGVYLNTDSGLGGFLDKMSSAFDQAAQERQTRRDLVYNKALPASFGSSPSLMSQMLGTALPDQNGAAADPNAPSPGILSQIAGMFGGAQPQSQPQTPNMPAPINGTPGGAAPPRSSLPVPMAYADPSTAPSMSATPQFSAPSSMPVPRPSFPPQPAPSPFGALSPGGFGPQASAPPIFAASQGTPSGPNANAQTALSFYQSKGLSPIAAAALVGGFQNESGRGLNTSALNPGDGSDGSNSVGIAQWNGARAQGLQQFAAANRLDPNDINTQLQYSWQELNGPEHATLSALQQAQNPVAATAAALGYERPAGWTAANPTGAKTFGSRLQSTVGLAGLGQPGGAASMPAITASGMGLQLAPGNQSPPTPSQSSAQPQPAPAPAPAMGYTPPTAPMAAAPGQQAISAAAAGPAISVPGYSGQFTRGQANDADGVPSQAEWDAAAKQQAAGGGAATSIPTGGPLGGASTAQPTAPAPTRPAAAPSIPAGAQPVGAPGTTLPSAQIQALLSTPTTRPLGMALWQQALTQKSLGFLQTPDGTILTTNPQTGQVSVAYQGAPKPQVVGTSLVDPSTGRVIYDGRGNNAVSQIGEDQFGNKIFGTIDKDTGKVTPIQAPTGGAGQAVAPGGVDNSLVGDDYLKQFSPEVQAAVKNYVGGMSMPTGNPRQGFAQTVKTIAQKYGNDIGVPADDTSFNARRAMRNNLSVATPSSLGGQINTGNTAIGHLADLSNAVVDLRNVDLGSTWLSHAANTVRGWSTDQAAKVNALQDAAQHYGQEITKFYAGSPGGEAERQSFLSKLDAANSPQQLGAVIQTEAELMPARLSSIQNQIQGTLGPMASQYPVIRPDSQKALDTINGNIAKLRGVAPASTAPAAAKAGAPSQADLLAEARRRGLVH